LTILESISISTGNPADDLILSELSPISNLEVRLNDEMARRRIFPALDLNLVQAREEEELFSAQEKKFDKLLRKEYLTRHTPEALLDVLEESESFEYFRARIVSEQ
jgi:transcription termination factor Rho